MFPASCPTITLGSLSNGAVSSSYTGSVAASGGTGPYTYAVTSGTLTGTGLSLNTSTGDITGTPTVVSASFSVTATDANTCTGVQAYNLTFTCPTITLGSLSNGTVNSSYTGSVAASGGIGSYSYAVTSGTLTGSGLSLNASNGDITGTPVVTSLSFSVTATDANSCTGVQAYNLTFACPTITLGPTTLADGATGAGYSQNVTASGGVGPYTYAMTGGTLSTGLTVNSDGSITGTPADSGMFYFQVTATDANSCTGVQAETLHIAGTFVCPTITVGSAAPDGWRMITYPGNTYNASGGTAPYTFAVTAGSLPGGLTLSSGGALTGTPNGAGTFIYTITVTDANSCTGTFTDTVDVTACPTITLTPASLPNATQGVAYSQSIGSTGGNGSVTYAVTSGALPAGITLSGAGSLSGTATVPNTYNFTVTATDANGCTGDQAYSLTVDCPTITVNPASLTGVNVNVGYNVTITATGGTASYSFAVTSGSLPTGLSLAAGGALTGTPTVAGTYNFSVTATDANSCTGVRAYTLVIGAPAVFRVANVAGDTLDWRSTSTWVIESGSSVSGFPKRRDQVILDNNYKSGPYVITVGQSAADSCSSIQIGYAGNANTIKLLVKSTSNQTIPLTFGDSASGNFDMVIDTNGVADMEKSNGRFNILGFSTAGDSLKIKPGGLFYHHSSGSLSGIFIGWSKNIAEPAGTLWYKPPKTTTSVFFSFAGGVYGNIVLDTDSSCVFQGSSSLASAFGECVIKGDLTVMPGATLSPGNSGYEGTIWLKGNLVNNGKVLWQTTVSNYLAFWGSAPQTVSGNAVTLRNVFVANAAGVTLNTGTTVNGTVQTTGTLSYLQPQIPANISTINAAGSLSTGANTLTLASTGSLNEGSTPVLGTVSVTRPVTLSVNNTFGNIGYEVNATGTTPDTTTIVRTTGAHQTGYLGHQSIDRYYDITPKNNLGVSSTIGLSYATSELNGITESDLLIHRSTDAGSTWSGASGSVNTGTHKITASGVVGLQGRWTAAGTSTPLFVSHDLLVKKFADADGDINTMGDQTAQRWRINVYHDSVDAGTLVATGNPPSGVLTANALPAGNYIVEEADSTASGWITLGNYHNGANVSSSRTVNVTLAGGVNDTVYFINQKTASVSIAKMVSTDGVSSGSAHAWGLELYKGSVAPENRIDSVNATSLTAVGLQAGTYIAVEADSGASWTRINGNGSRFDTLTVTAAATVVDTFVNFQPNGITVTNQKDADGLFGTTGDRSTKAWHIDVHAGSVGGAIVATTENGTISLSGIGDGTYYVVAADTALWTRLGYVLNGAPVAGTSNTVAVTVGAGQSADVKFVLASPSYSVKYRSFLPNVLAVDTDNKGKAGKSVKAKLDKYIFSFSMIPPDTGINGVHIELAADVDTSRTFSISQVLTKTPGAKLKIWDITFADTVGPTDTIGFMGFSVKKNKLAKYFWTKNGVSTTAKPVSNKTIVVTLEGKLPMPNRINALEGALAHGTLVGVPQTDLKKYGWLAPSKAAEILKSLAEKGTFHTGTPKGFSVYTSGKPVLKAQKTLVQSKFNNVLVADLLALKLNIAASAAEITPLGFGELLYGDTTANPFNGLMVKEISALADTLMMGSYDTNGVHVFDDSTLAKLHTTVAAINGAFEGALDTISFSGALKFTGAAELKTVTFLHANPSVAPAKITPAPVDANVEPQTYALYQNYPNPFNPTTNIRFDLPLTSDVTLKVYNLLGQEVATLLNHAQLEVGVQEVQFNASRLASGVYFYRLEAKSVATEDNDVAGQTFSKVTKMLLIK